ncbi:MAG: CDP-glycerol glycerophosphotransferase family protein [Actinomycetota bacterium]|nr:CDP-glycerol glycerophosphotransferase family protein [Actinomycetota bacterium]
MTATPQAPAAGPVPAALARAKAGARRALPLVAAAPALLRARPRDDLVVFDSWGGRFSDSPRALSDELSRRAPGLEQAWVLAPGRPGPGPEGARAVRPQSAEQVVALRSARAVVTNRNLPRWFVKRRGCLYLQTWHGSPLKRVGFDVARDRRQASQIRHDVGRWDVLLAQSPFAAERFRAAFRFGGEIWETGYPHTDVLVGPDATPRRDQVRQRLGIPADGRVVLYAPTFRDDARGSDGRHRFDLRLDFDRLEAGLGPDWTVLVRAHTLTRWEAPAGDERVRDVAGVEEITDLYLAADVLVTDYSSAMFDFAVTGKPIVFFAYDLEHYRDDVRGFYWPLEDEAPGPVVRDTDGVVEALRDLTGVQAAQAARYAAFRQKFVPFDDGTVSQRVVDRLLATL